MLRNEVTTAIASVRNELGAEAAIAHAPILYPAVPASEATTISKRALHHSQIDRATRSSYTSTQQKDPSSEFSKSVNINIHRPREAGRRSQSPRPCHVCQPPLDQHPSPLQQPPPPEPQGHDYNNGDPTPTDPPPRWPHPSKPAPATRQHACQPLLPEPPSSRPDKVNQMLERAIPRWPAARRREHMAHNRHGPFRIRRPLLQHHLLPHLQLAGGARRRRSRRRCDISLGRVRVVWPRFFFFRFTATHTFSRPAVPTT